jgi:hypothetical protein
MIARCNFDFEVHVYLFGEHRTRSCALSQFKGKRYLILCSNKVCELSLK